MNPSIIPSSTQPGHAGRSIEHIITVIPAHDEGRSIGACLRSIASARSTLPSSLRSSSVVVVDRCRDDTARSAALHLDPKRDLLLHTDRGSAGAARGIGVAAALDRITSDPERVWVCSTDADSTVPTDWFEIHLEAARTGHVAVAGVVELDDAVDPLLASQFESAYARFPDGTHPHVHGANLGFRGDAYLAAGGWGTMSTGEDHDLWGRLASLGTTLASVRLSVTTASRLIGRAPGRLCGRSDRPHHRFGNRSMTGLRELLLSGDELPDPGSGRTPDRLAWLMEFSRQHDISTGRLAEAHVDAVSILHEAGRDPVAGCLYGVWASSSPNDPTIVGDRLTGTKRFCSGVGIVDRALVIVRRRSLGTHETHELLVDIDVSGLTHDAASWASNALVDTATGDARLDQSTAASDVVESARWYLDRPGFWHGACGPAACWAGGTIGLVDAALGLVDDDPHRRSHTGALVAARWSLEAVVRQAGAEIDLDPADRRSAEIRARSLRHMIERTSSDAADRFSRAFGPRPFVSDAAIAQRFADLHLYLRQHHAERELGELSLLVSHG